MGRDKQSDSSFDGLFELVKQLHALHKQMCKMQRPVVDDVCHRVRTVSEHELGHCFDAILDCACIKDGYALFQKLCDTFRSRYPECVADYIETYEDLYGTEEEKPKKPARRKSSRKTMKKAV